MLRLPRDFQFNVLKTTTAQNLPDTQNEGAHAISGANVPILQVGISNFRLPLRLMSARGAPVPVEAAVTGTVSLAADRKGINMSRLMRIFYGFAERPFTPELLEEILRAYQEQLESTRARLRVDFSYPLLKKSLRSGLEGYQYYRAAYEGILDDLGRFRRRLHFDFVYSSACPASDALAEHAEAQRGVHAIPHSQRSKARVSVEVAPGKVVTLEDLQALCERALQTEVQVLVRREDEQAFAELNGAHPKFVEDAVRLLYEALAGDPRIIDFQVACAHLESLHAHDAVAVITKGVDRGFSGELDDFRALLC